jgi:hypothetical protein
LTATIPSLFNEIDAPLHLSVFQSSQRAVFNAHKELFCPGFLFNGMHSPFFRTLYRRPTLPIAFTLFPRSETLDSGQQLRPGDAQKRTSIKTHKRDKVKLFLGENLALFWLFLLLGKCAVPRGYFGLCWAKMCWAFSGEAVTQESLGRSPMSVNLRGRDQDRCWWLEKNRSRRDHTKVAQYEVLG